MTLELGVSKIDITPAERVPLAGFAARNNKPYEGIASRIYARTAFFRHISPAGEQTKGIFVSADLLWWGESLSKQIRAEISKKWDVPESCILLHGTHNHSGPQTNEPMHPLLGLANSQYLQFLKQRLHAGIEQAFQDLEETDVYRSSGECRLGVHRRAVVNGQVIFQANEAGEMDPEMLLFRFRRKGEEKDKALFVHYAVHPVISRENQVSAEFTGAAMNRLEQTFEGCTAFYLQGCCGDINVDFTKNKMFQTGDEQQVEAFAEKLAQTAEKILSHGGQKLQAGSIAGRTYRLSLPFQPLHAEKEMVEMAASGESPYREWAQHMLSEESRNEKILEMTVMKLGEEMSFLAMNAEMVTAYGLYMKEKSNGKVVPLPYTNGMTGYIPTAEQLDEGGYEAEGSIYYFYLPGKLDRSVEQQVKGLADQAIDWI